jgi:hypothetical protein
LTTKTVLGFTEESMTRRFSLKVFSTSLLVTLFCLAPMVSAATWLKLEPVVGGIPGSSIVPGLNAQANNNQVLNVVESDGFNPGLAVNNSTLYNVPARFNSAARIREFLASQGSFLANYKVETSFENDDDMLAKNPDLRRFQGQKMDFSEFVWQLSTSNLGNHCSIYNPNICVNASEKPINPAFILGMIQRESGLVYGSKAKSDPNSDSTKFLIDRATGYLCTETSDKTKSCWDENPDWKYYKGLFRQTFYMNRNLLLNAKRCEIEGVNVYGRQYKVGNAVVVDGREIKLENPITCALYIYTPHAFAQKSLYNVMNYLGANSGSYQPSTTPAPTSGAPVVLPQLPSTPVNNPQGSTSNSLDSMIKNARTMFWPGSQEDKDAKPLQITNNQVAIPGTRFRLERVE